MARSMFSAFKGSFARLCLFLASLPVHSQTFKVLYTFTGAPNDGQFPVDVLVQDTAGNLYGTTEEGGTGKWGGSSQLTCGTGFMLTKAGKEVAHLSFQLDAGCDPMAGLLRDAEGDFYGTTFLGGNTTCYEYGCGTVYKVSNTGNETMLHEFTGSPDGEEPEALLVHDSEGNLYGTTYLGGAFQDAGTVFKVDSHGNETILYNFCSEPDCADGESPIPGVIRDAAGNLYGVTAGGGGGAGVVFELDTSGQESVLYAFSGGSDGAAPNSLLLFDSQGNLYGTTEEGGNLNCFGGSGCGVVFELSPQSNGTWREATLYTFCSLTNCADGQFPKYGPLVRDNEGNLYGTTLDGGAFYRNCNQGSCGTVFKLSPNGQETVLHSFSGGSDGAEPWAGLVMDSYGNLYGTAASGGDAKCPVYTTYRFSPSGCGVVFEMTP